MSQIAVNQVTTTMPQNGWQLFLSLAKGLQQPGDAWRDSAYRRKFMLRSLASAFTTGQLLSKLAQQPLLDELLHVQPGLPCRLHRPYLSVNFNRKDTLNALCFHYHTLNQRMPEKLLRDHLTQKGARLAQLVGKDESRYSIDFCAISNLDKEGEATLVMLNEEGTALAELTFTLCHYRGKTTLFIGGLQGAKSWVPHDAIQNATKACHGLFPKRLLLEAACQLAQHLDARQILAVSNSTHIYRSWRYQKKKQDKLHADYDSFWLSMKGELLADGYFRMPGEVARKPLEDIASKKRAEYRRRYSLLGDMVESIASQF
ncbi:VirK/YbjX family protein [Enterobacteriaceae bacterium H20N1]|uniref:VirK/YbjX family protein n=1 Tax=Dryocola boscaweniae TaxID=2925397 RepID=A0A9X2W6Z0_9ENTR|nr:VirK/YbjX family protein [Dryocola boscaweniae]MCT4701352.1 VirK/YbjX family protein [Dryocola boscaweniae]MCT4718412.1 VirK/YbjX family protein [Dryocola boscaweniae]